MSTLISAMLLGLLAGGVSCAAVQGGLLAGLVSRQRAGGQANSIGDDLAPVGGFLAGKFVSHLLLGALLGAIGNVLELSITVRTMAQIAAGVLIIMLALAQLGVPGFRGFIIEPPASWVRLVRGRARSQSVLAPAALGVVSVLIPCGATISVMAVAVTTGSPLMGAGVMAMFVLGTAPLFTVLGYVAARVRRVAGPWRRRLAVATGLVVLALGLYTFNGGLELSGSPLAASQVVAAFSDEEPVASEFGDDGSPVQVRGGTQYVVISAVTGAYRPDNLQVQPGLPTVLVIKSEDARGCVRAFVIPRRGIQKTLPERGETQIELGKLEPGTLRYMCSMGMYTGQLTVTDRA